MAALRSTDPAPRARKPVPPAVGAGLSPARLVIGFLRHEISLAAGLLTDVSAVLTEEFASLSTAKAGHVGSVSRITEVMQYEDLIQQRLEDLDAGLGVLEGVFDGADETGVDGHHDLGARVAAELRLEETRARLRRRLDGEAGPPADTGVKPHLGEVDLF